MTDGMLAYLSEEQRARAASARVGIAGAGGLGSNAAMMLARSGVGTLVLIDGDVVEPSNLGRQQYFPRHVGQAKVEALAELLLALRPDIRLVLHRAWLDKDNVEQYLQEADLWLEAMDGAEAKALFSSAALRMGKPVICASGMGGFGGRAMTRRVLRGPRSLVAVVGDGHADVAQFPPLAPRVTQCAAMQADAALEYLFTQNIKPLL